MNTPVLPPSVPDVERSVLAACFGSRKGVETALDVLRPKDFHLPKHREIFEAVVAIYEQGGVPDLRSLAARMPGSEADLVEISMAGYHAENVPFESRVVKEKSMLRQLLLLSKSIENAASDFSSDPYEVIEKTEKALLEVSSGTTASSTMGHTSELVHAAANEIDELASGAAKKRRVLTGFNSYDYKTNGWVKNRLIVIAGRPSMGKTAFALGCARNISQTKGLGIFSLEMSKEELTLRLLCSECGIRYNDLQAGRVKTTRKSLTEGMRSISELNLTIDDGSGLTFHQIKSRTQRMIRERAIVGIVIDYLQLMAMSSQRTRDEEIGTVTRALKGMAKELSIFVVLLSQLNRGVEGRRNKRPILSDLRESGNIEQDADDVVFIHRPEKYDETDRPGVAEIIIEKQRNGDIGVAELRFVKEHMRFENPPPAGMESMVPPPEEDSATI